MRSILRNKRRPNNMDFMNPTPEHPARLPLLLLLLLLPAGLCGGCLRSSPREVVVYAALDREFSEPLLRDFGEQTGIRVLAKYDVESNKTVGLASALVAEQNRPRCDVFWNNELLHSVRLAQAGLVQPSPSPHSADYPAQYTAADHTWHGFAARARILIVNTELLPDPAAWPDSIADLADPHWKNNCGLARPLTGTTASHAAFLFESLGPAEATRFFQAVHDNAIAEGGNRQVARHVGEGRYAWGLTDTDDAILEIENGSPVRIVWPDQGADGSGALLIPNSLVLVKGGPNPQNGQLLIDWLLRAESESALAACPSAQIPLNRKAAAVSRVWPAGPAPRIHTPDPGGAARNWDRPAGILQEIFR